MSSSHLFLGLPIALLILYLVLSSGFQSAAFLNHLSLGDTGHFEADYEKFIGPLRPSTRQHDDDDDDTRQHDPKHT